jgi:hypothetical protein
MTMTLSDKAKSLIRLYQRSPHDADEWAVCSEAVIRFIRAGIPDELVEIDGLRVRLNKRGKIVAEYM